MKALTMEPAERLTPDQIRERAYDLWDRHHRPEGYDLQFWLMAERELKAERRTKAGPGVAIEEDAGAYEALTT